MSTALWALGGALFLGTGIVWMNQDSPQPSIEGHKPAIDLGKFLSTTMIMVGLGGAILVLLGFLAFTTSFRLNVELFGWMVPVTGTPLAAIGAGGVGLLLVYSLFNLFVWFGSEESEERDELIKDTAITVMCVPVMMAAPVVIFAALWIVYIVSLLVLHLAGFVMYIASGI